VLVSNATNLNFDFRWLALPAAASLRPGVTLGTFFDWASGHDVDQPNDTFSSYGLTFRLKWAHVQADLAYGLRLIHPAFADAQPWQLARSWDSCASCDESLIARDICAWH